MNVPTKLAAFGALLGVAFAAALGVGAAVGPIDLKNSSRDLPAVVVEPSAGTTTTVPGGAHGHGGGR